MTQNRLKGSGWILILLLIAQPILLIVGYQAISRIQVVRDTTEVQLAALPEVRAITDRLVKLGEYRGSCAAAVLMDSSAQSMLETLCKDRYNELVSVEPSLPVLQKNDILEFFQQVTERNREDLAALNRLYIESKAILDPAALTYQLGFEVYRFYPQLMEHLGVARGSLAKIRFGLIDPKVLTYTKGGIAQIGNTFISTMLLSSPEMSKYKELVSEATDYVDRVTDVVVVGPQTSGDDQRSQTVSDLFIEGIELIRGLAADADEDALELEEALNERLDAATEELQLTFALLLILQFLLLMSAKRSLETVRALNQSVQAEHDAREKLEVTLDKQKEMFSIIGHELRTPVATVNMLTTDAGWEDRDKLSQIKEISDNLLHVLEDLRVVISPKRALAAKKAERDDPVRVVTRALSPLEGLVRDKGLTLQLLMPEKSTELFSFHTQALRQSVTNLVKNAAVHSGGSKIVVNLVISSATADSATLTVRVEDDGKGIPEHLRASVFKAFGRGNTQADGSGLGLFIVKSMADLMGGKLTYSKSSMGGAAFELSLPMTRAKADSAESDEQPSQRLSLDGVRVLFAEDDAMLRMLTEKLLTKEGAQVSSFENGRLALDAFRPEDYDLVITDLMMPQMNGHELTTAVRAQSKEVIIIAVTAAVLGTETEQFLDEGADFVLPKPITKRSLTEALEEIRHTRNSSV